MTSAPTQLPLDGIAIRTADRSAPSVVAGRWLARFGARVTADPHAAADVAIAAIGDATAADVPTALLVGPSIGDVPGLPGGTLTYASGLGLAGAAALALLGGDHVRVDRHEIAVQVLLPLVLAASYGTAAREPAPPRRIGQGYVQCDLASGEDSETFEGMLASLGPRANDARAVADEAQAWRLPVCAYDRRPPVSPLPADPGGSMNEWRRGESTRPAPLSGTTVCDLTTMWGGPLATWLLAGAGAEVHKVEPAARVDGTRALDGRGIHPRGADHRRGDASALFNALNRGKRRRDLDARGDREELGALAANSDLVIDNFSRRVMSNLDLGPARLRESNPTVATVAMPAFPADHRWQVAMGPGIHAATGLGDLGDGRVAVPVVAYPDPLAGLAGFALAVATLLAARRGHRPAHQEITLFGCAAELAAISPVSGLVAQRDGDLGRRLLDDDRLARVDAWETIDDGAGRHRYPAPLFRGAWRPLALAPAPPLRQAVSPGAPSCETRRP